MGAEAVRAELTGEDTTTYDGSAECGALHGAEKVDRDLVLRKAARNRPDDEPKHAGEEDPAGTGQVSNRAPAEQV